MELDSGESIQRLNVQGNYSNRFAIFYDLMQYRISEVLLVSSLYDDFILEEDGRLTDELFTAFSELQLSSPPPRITRVPNGTEALEAIEKFDFDIVITMRRLDDMDPFNFGSKVKSIKPEMPVVLLLTNQSDVIGLPEDQDGIDFIFTFSGDSDIFLAIIKVVEDMKNVDNDTKLGKVRIILIVEDTVQYYSIFLPTIYGELLKQTQEMMEESLNLSHRLLRRKGRPKILLAKTYEEATTYYDRYKEYLLGVITDVAFPYKGEKDYKAGEKLVRFLRQEKEYLPVLLQSSDPDNIHLAEELSAQFVHKNSINYLREFRKFMKNQMMFGDFIFRNNDDEQVGRADTMREFENVLKDVPKESIIYHGKKNDFSNWLYSRGEYQLANELAPYKVSHFDDIESIREFLLDSFEKRRRERQQGIITNFYRKTFDFSTPFTRYGTGSLGGKGRGIAFISALITKNNLTSSYKNTKISIPETLVLATDIFDQFIEKNELFNIATQEFDDNKIIHSFVSAELPQELQNDLRKVIKVTKVPLAVRSSSLLEDSQFHPLAGIYDTYMLSNDQSNEKTRFKYLCQAIKLVYASAFTSLAKSYIQSLGQKIETEKMAVIIQKVVGKNHENKRYYPDFSGIVKSYNYYPIGYMKPEDGIAEVAVGLGEMVVSGGQSLQFSPKYPNILPQASTIETALENSQHEFYSIKLNVEDVDLKKGEFSTLQRENIKQAKEDGILKWLAATYDHQNHRLRNTLRGEGPPIITMPFILQYPKFPLANILDELLYIGKEALGYSVEIEFAVNLDYQDEKEHEFYILQIRPLVINQFDNEEIQIDGGNAIIKSSNTLGNGIIRNINDIVYVKPESFDKTKTLDIRDEISQINKHLREKQREYILIGPGRWGTRDRFLGIPVRWNDLDNAHVIIETDLKDFVVDPSQGSHFFTNITSTNRGYFSIKHENEDSSIDWDWINKQETIQETTYVKHVFTEEPLTVKIDGKSGEGVITQI